jgi:hypothetical protein
MYARSALGPGGYASELWNLGLALALAGGLAVFYFCEFLVYDFHALFCMHWRCGGDIIVLSS